MKSARNHGCRYALYQLGQERLLSMENRWVRLVLHLDKGAEISEFRHKGTDINALWRREGGGCERLINPAGAGADFFYNYQGGWQESFPIGNSEGYWAGSWQALHGEVRLLPWDCTIETDEEDQLTILLEVQCRKTPFRLRRRILLDSRTARICMQETVMNRGAQTLPYVWGHHPAFGRPLLSGGSRFDFPAGTFRSWKEEDSLPRRLAPGKVSREPVLPGRSGGLVDLRAALDPGSGIMDHLEVKPENDGFVALRNPQEGLGFAMEWDLGMFPYLWQWHCAHADTGYPFWGQEYLVALEPFSSPIGGIHDSFIQELAPRLQPGEEVQTWLRAGFISGTTPFDGRYLMEE